ncbi:class I SAM-dependent methyltransferase [Pseudonocardia kunmingensis]|uniref:Methyltransferase family protein n=1 Tax=Pseudonocardia kunmingensis TaxID=630975 RepID=A0A543DZX7_9PSEU|nr:class I SAM-dependent methyltransferase [Pseudonocardia kunmingensis]TQM14901.1 methyltransferase family protein [Pseudonocardia kunmingensis]
MDHDVTNPAPASGEQFWDEFYAAEERIWSGNANPLLVQEVEAFPPGTALDLGCGEGADAIWLARNGWRVTAVDIAGEALRRGAEHAREAGVADAVRWERHDLSRSFPDGEFDLVSAQFLHSPVAREGERDAILRRAAAAVAPGGVLLVAGHAGWPSWVSEPPQDFHFPTTGEVLASLDLDPGRWRVEREELIERDATDPEGRPGRRADNVLRVRRAG